MKIDSEAHHSLVSIYEGNPWEVRKRLKAFIDTVEITDDPEKPKNVVS